MSTLTPKLGLVKPDESEYADIGVFNGNADILDSLCHIKTAGTLTASYVNNSGDGTKVATWRYKEFTDGTIHMSTLLDGTDIKTNTGSTVPYYSASVSVYFPLELQSIYDTQMHLASSSFSWIQDQTNRSTLDQIKFRLFGFEHVTTNQNKQIYITVKGVKA